jgi:hypothetical protein
MADQDERQEAVADIRDPVLRSATVWGLEVSGHVWDLNSVTGQADEARVKLTQNLEG